MKRPVIAADVDKINRPKETKVQDEPKWSFSFEYFKEIKYFGFASAGKPIDSTWFVSLIERLSELSKMTISSFFENHYLRNKFRYHDIDWNSTNIPIRKGDLDWIAPEILTNDNEYPFFQFHISKALGRVVGFWNEENTIFNIVLFDPLHNIQPAGGKYDYKVHDSYPLGCKYSSILKDIEDLRKIKCKNENCEVHNKLNRLPSKENYTNIVFGFVDDEYLGELDKALQKKNLSDILVDGIIYNA